jgi:hypothetical protein
LKILTTITNPLFRRRYQSLSEDGMLEFPYTIAAVCFHNESIAGRFHKNLHLCCYSLPQELAVRREVGPP